MKAQLQHDTLIIYQGNLGKREKTGKEHKVNLKNKEYFVILSVNRENSKKLAESLATYNINC